MGDYKEKNGTTRVGDFLRKVGKVVPEVLEVAGNLTGIEALERAGDIIRGKSEMSEADKEIMLSQIEAAKEVEIARLADLDSARRREVELAKTGRTDWMMKLVGVVILALLITSVITVFFFDLSNKDMAHFILGEIFGFGGSMVFFYFGSSKSSQDKTELMRR